MSQINKLIKTKAFFSFLFFVTFHIISAQDVTTIQANNEDISDNLDLEAVASIFGESKDVEDFEKRLNDPKTQISNLDLNNDGEVDYLRVMETGTEKNVHTISIQSVIGKDQYQEVATIDVEKDSKGESQVQVIGNVDMYGPNYYVTPVYPVVPVFFTFFWIATYHPWHSPWYWGYHPPYFRPWSPYSPYRYRSNVHVHVNVHNSYHRTNVRMNNNTVNINSKNNNYFKNNPSKKFDKRNPGVSNRSELNKNRKTSASKKGINNKSDLNKAAKNKGVNTNKGYKSSGKPVTKKPSSNKPSTRPSSKPNTKPSTRPSTRPSTKPSSSHNTKPTNKSSYSKPSSRPTNNYSRQAPSRSSHRRTRH